MRIPSLRRQTVLGLMLVVAGCGDGGQANPDGGDGKGTGGKGGSGSAGNSTGGSGSGGRATGGSGTGGSAGAATGGAAGAATGGTAGAGIGGALTGGAGGQGTGGAGGARTGGAGGGSTGGAAGAATGGAGGALTGGAGGAPTGGAGGAATGGAGGAATGGAGGGARLTCTTSSSWQAEIVLSAPTTTVIEGNLVSDAVGGLHAVARTYPATSSDTVVSSYKPPGGTWTVPTIATTFGAARPLIAVDATFRDHVVSTTAGNGDRVVYSTSPAGAPWTGTNADNPALNSTRASDIAIDANGNPQILVGSPGSVVFFRSNGGTWVSQTIVMGTPSMGDPQVATLVATPTGQTLLVYQNSLTQQLNSVVIGIDGNPGTPELIAATANAGSAAVLPGGGFAVVYSDATGVHRALKTGAGTWMIDAVSTTGRLACRSHCLAVDGLGRLHTLILDAGSVHYAHTDQGGAWQSEPADFGDAAPNVLSLDIDPAGVLHAFARGGTGGSTATVRPFRHLYRCPAADSGNVPVTAPAAAGTWQERASPTRPITRWQGQGMVFDSSQHEMVLFGGRLDNQNVVARVGSETWTYPTSGAGWTRKALGTGTVPDARLGHGMAFDSARSRVVLMGGGFYTDVWEWDGATATWATRATTGTPPAALVLASANNGPWTRLAYDSARAKVVVLITGTCPASCWNLWDWDTVTGAFTARPSVDPKPVTLTSIAYDATSQLIIAHGGGATWEWNPTSGAWIDRTGTTPAPTTGELVAGPNGRFVVYDGTSTWEWSRATAIWRQRALTQVGPAARRGAFFAYQPERQTTWLFGGAGLAAQYLVTGRVPNPRVDVDSTFDTTFEWMGPAQAP